MAATLRVILGVDNSSKLMLPSGIPGSVDILKEEIQRQFGLTEDFRLQYRDVEFDNEYMNLTTTGDIEDKSTIKVIYTNLNSAPSTVPTTAPTAASRETLPQFDAPSLPDTDILSSSDSSASCSSLRLRKWPLNFPIPKFSFDVEFQLHRAQQEYENNGILLDPSPKLKSDILDMLVSEIAKYKVYPSSGDIDDVAKALIQKYPFLKETGSVTGCEGWKVSLKYKMAN